MIDILKPKRGFLNTGNFFVQVKRRSWMTEKQEEQTAHQKPNGTMKKD